MLHAIFLENGIPPRRAHHAVSLGFSFASRKGQAKKGTREVIAVLYRQLSTGSGIKEIHRKRLGMVRFCTRVRACWPALRGLQARLPRQFGSVAQIAAEKGSGRSFCSRKWRYVSAAAAITLATGATACSMASSSSILAESEPHVAADDKPGISHHNDAFITQLQAIVGRDNVVVDKDIIRAYESPFALESDVDGANGAFFAVVTPESTEQVSAAIALCNKLRIPVVAHSGGTCLEGQTRSTVDGVMFDFSAHMNNILSVDEADMTCRVQPGVDWMSLNAHLADTQLFFPVDPGPGAQIGGMIGTSCSGTNAMRYGTMKDWVVTMTVVLPDGQVVRTRSQAKKSSSGYDLHHLMIGAEGTLGIVTEATIRLTNRPSETIVGTCAFDDVGKLAEVVAKVLTAGISAQCLELVDETSIKAANSYNHTGRQLEMKPHLFFKLIINDATRESEVAKLRELCTRAEYGGSTFYVGRTAEECESIWQVRKTILLSSLATYGGENIVALNTDVAVPMSRLPDLIRKHKAEAKQANINVAIVGHAGDGNFHSLIFYDKTNELEKQRARDLSHQLVVNSLSLGGTCSGEHGIGTHKREYLVPEYGLRNVKLMWGIKRLFDPNLILNPGKLLPTLE